MVRPMEALDLHPDTPLEEVLRRLVAAFLERRGMSARRFGAEVLGDPGFVFSQARGRSVRLATADRVLAYMGLAPLGPGFRREVEAFLEETGARASVLGAEAAGRPVLRGQAPPGSVAQARDGRPGPGLDGGHPRRDRGQARSCPGRETRIIH